MKGLIVGIAAVIVLLVAAVAALLFVGPVNVIKECLLAAARDATGREVRIDGAFELAPGLTTSVRLKGLVFGNAHWGARPELATVESLAFDIEILPLLSGHWTIPRLSLAGADILLERNEQGIGNWELAAVDVGHGGVPWPGEVMLDNVVLVYRNGAGGAGPQLALGIRDLDGEVSIDTSGARPRIDGRLSSTRIDLGEWMPLRQAAAGSGGERDADAVRERVFPEDPLPFEALKAADAGLDVAVGELFTPALPLEDLKVALSLKDGKLDAAPFSGRVAGGDVAGSIGLDGSGATPVFTLNIGAKALDLGELLAKTGVTDTLEGEATLDVALKGRGASVAAIMAGLDGHGRLIMGEGRARTESFDLLVGGLSQAMGSLFAEKSDWTTVECIVGDFSVEDGLATPRLMAVNTEHVLVFGEGGVNLGEESIDMKLTPKPKMPTLNVSVPVEVGGTFLEPTFAPEELSTLRRLGGLAGTVFFPAAALLALVDLGSSDDPCIEEIGTWSDAGSAAEPSRPADRPALRDSPARLRSR